MRLRFSISNLLLLTAIVGIVIAWWIDRSQLDKKYQANRDTLYSILSDTGKVRSALQTKVTNFTIQYDPQTSLNAENANAAIHSAVVMCRDTADILLSYEYAIKGKRVK